MHLFTHSSQSLGRGGEGILELEEEEDKSGIEIEMWEKEI